MATKFLTEDGVRRLWAAIEAKFLDASEIETIIENLPTGEGDDMIALTNKEIDDITGYVDINTVEDLNTILATKDKATLYMANPIAVAEPITIGAGKDVTIYISNEITNNTTTAAFVVVGGNLVINGRGGSIVGQTPAVAVRSGEATVNGGSYTTTRAGQVMTAMGEGSVLTLNNVNLHGQETAAMAFDGATLNINGGEYETVDNFVVGTNGTTGRGKNTINIKNVKLNAHIASAGYEACGIYVANDDIVTIDGNTKINVDGGCGILMRAGTVTVKSGVQIITTAAAEPGWVGDNKVKMSQAGIIYHEAANYPGKEGMSLVVEKNVIFDVAGEEVEVISNEETPNVTIGA